MEAKNWQCNTLVFDPVSLNCQNCHQPIHRMPLMFYPIATHLVLAKTLANLALFWGPILATWLGVNFFLLLMLHAPLLALGHDHLNHVNCVVPEVHKQMIETLTY